MLPNNILLQDRYQIIEPIGRGGMGAVYKAIDTRLRSTVALKQTLVDGAALSKAFEREAQLLASLRHPMLPRVSDHFLDTRGQFLIMEYVPGDDLGTLLERRKEAFDVANVLRWADQLLDVLDYLHTHNPPVIHRDIKPQNIKLTDRNEIILLDFGLAKGSSLQTKATSTGSIFGYTPHYAPLEQIHGTGTDCRSDLYLLAATLYHLFTANMPVDAMTRATAKVNDEADPLLLASAINPNVPPAIAALLHQAMSQKASQRPTTAAAMRTALHEASQGVTTPVGNSKTVVHVLNDQSTVIDTALLPHAGASNRQTAPAGTSLARSIAPDAANGTRASRTPRAWGRWMWVAVLVIVALGGGIAVLFATKTSSVSSQPTVTLAPAVAVASTNTSAPTSQPTVTVDILQAAAATQTTVALAAAATSMAIANLVNELQSTQATVNNITSTTVAETEQAALATTNAQTAQADLATVSIQAAQATADAEATTQQLIVQETEAARPSPTPLPRPTPRPTRTPAPPTTPPEAKAECRVQGQGSKFAGSCSPGSRIEGQTGSCITGRVIANDGTFFKTVFLSVDNKGRTIRIPLDGGNYDASSGGYSVCKLGAGEWGVTVINVNRGNGIEENPSQGASQVIVRLSGADGEHAIVSFRE